MAAGVGVTRRRSPRVKRYGGAAKNTTRYVSKAGGTRGEARGVKRNLRAGGPRRQKQLKTLRKQYRSEFKPKRVKRAMKSARRVGTNRIGGQTFSNKRTRIAGKQSRKSFNRATRKYIARNNLQGKPGKVNAFRKRRATLYKGTHKAFRGAR